MAHLNIRLGYVDTFATYSYVIFKKLLSINMIIIKPSVLEFYGDYEKILFWNYHELNIINI